MQVNIKLEEMDEEEAEEKPEGEEGKMEIKKEEAGGGAKPDPEMGRLVMTIDGQQKQLPFGPNDLLTTATMLDGDKVRGWLVLQLLTKHTRFK